MSDNKIANELTNAYVPISPTEDDLTQSNPSDLEVPNQKFPRAKNYVNEESDVGNSQSISYQSKSSNSKKNPHLIYSKYDKLLKGKKLVNEAANSAKMPNYPKLIQQYESQVLKMTAEINDLKKEIYKVKQENLSLQEENGFTKLEKEKISNIKDNEIKLLNEQLIGVKDKNKKLSVENEENSKKIDEYQPKVWKYDELNEKYKKLTDENSKLFESNNNINNTMSQIKKDYTDLNSKFETLKLENENLKQDKMFLNKNLMVDDEKIKSQNAKITQLEQDIREMRRINQNYIDKLTDKNLNLDNTYKDKVNKEIQSMKEKYEKERDTLKKQYDDNLREKTNYLKEERDDYKNKLSALEKTLKEKEDSLNLCQNELRNLNTKANEETSYLKIQLNSKTEELNSRISVYEEQVAALSLFKNENETLKEKLDYIRGELIKRESEYRSEVAEYKAQISILKEKLSAYDNIENELDKVIVDSAIASEADNTKDNKDIIKIIQDIPTTNKRRINQCLALANKVKIISLENEKLKNMNEQLNNELQISRDEIKLYKNVSENVKQPYAYLIRNLQDNELQIFKLKQELEKKDQTINKLNLENSLYQEKVNNLSMDLKTIVNNRQKLNDLESVITNYMQSDNGGNTQKFSSTNVSVPYYSSNNLNGMSQNVYSNYSQNIFQQPEKDNLQSMNIQNGISTQQSSQKVPNWYLQLKSKKLYSS